MKKILYLGTILPKSMMHREDVLHYPVIRLVPKTVEDERVRFCLDRLSFFSHVIFTSKNAVEILWGLCRELCISPEKNLDNKCISIGDITSSFLSAKSVTPLIQAKEFTQEGIVDCIEGMGTDISYVFYPRSSLARPFLSEYLIAKKIPHETIDLYDTVFQKPEPIPSLETIDEIIFTSPSTVEGYFQAFHYLPQNVKVSCQGPITENFLSSKIKNYIDYFFLKELNSCKYEKEV